MTVPEVRFARSGDVDVAYQVVGSGPIDLVFAGGTFTHLEMYWAEPHYRRFCERLAEHARLILFDKRGMGLSDRVRAATIGERMDDIRAVMDAVGSERAAIFGVSEGGPLAILFAATYPERAIALILAGAEVKEETTDEWPWGEGTRAAFESSMAAIPERWGRTSGGVDAYAPSLAQDEAFRAWWPRMLVQAATPAAAEAFMRMAFEIDVRHVLPSISTPTLVVHRTADRICDVHNGRYLAEHISGARYLELPGADHLPWAGGENVLDAMLAFLAEQSVLEASRDPIPADMPEALPIPAPVEATGALGLEARATVLLAEGRVAASRGAYPDARSMLARAAELYRQAEHALPEARARFELACAAADGGDQRLADAEARTSLTTFRRLGMTDDAERAAALLRALNLPRAARGAAGAARLSRRECEILRLVAAGRSNDEIAGDLVLSPHTVHRHVGNILTKLAVSSRAAAVAEAARSGLL